MLQNSTLPDKFNIRIYGICIREECVLMVHENLNGFEFTKFPGGGLEFGEGLEEGLKREIREELGLAAKVKEHFYTTDFFQRSAFKSNEQLISVYYLIDIPDLPPFDFFPISSKQSDRHSLEFFWCDLKTLVRERATFTIDKYVIGKLINL